MEFIQLPSIQTDSSFIDVDTFKPIPSSIEKSSSRAGKKRKNYNIKRQITGKGMKHPENSGEPTKKNKTCTLCLQTGHHQFIYKVFENMYHTKPLRKSNDAARAMLAKSFPVIYGSLVFNLKN